MSRFIIRLYRPFVFAALRRPKSTLQDRVLRSFPEVDTVFGKAGRAETATDPAPLWRERGRQAQAA